MVILAEFSEELLFIKDAGSFPAAPYIPTVNGS